MSRLKILTCATASLALAGTAAASSFQVLGPIPAVVDGNGPQSSPIVVGGMIYGTTSGGGSASQGTVYGYNPATGATSIACNLQSAQNSYAGSLLNYGGLLYGPSGDTLYSCDPSTGLFTNLYTFPTAGSLDYVSELVNSGGVLYGVTTTGGTDNHGTIFGYNPATGTVSTLYNFTGAAGDGSAPRAALLNVNGILYGTTWTGGTNNLGTVFSFDPATSTETVLYRFTGQSDGANPVAPLTSVGGLLYGTTANTNRGPAGGGIFALNPNSGTLSPLYTFNDGNIEGVIPGPALLNIGGMLYGTRVATGPNHGGSIFAFNTTTNSFQIIYNMMGGADGATLYAGVANIGNLLYAAAAAGGTGIGNVGTLFQVDANTGTETTLHDFLNSNQSTFASSLLSVGSLLYGTSGGGGGLNRGSVFTVSPSSGAVQTLYSFQGGVDGQAPTGELINFNGTLYGTTQFGGAKGYGTVYALDPTTGVETNLHSFGVGFDGADPTSALVNDGGLLYGTTSSGGAHEGGTIFQVDPSTGIETTLYSIKPRHHAGGPTTLINVGGILYGVYTGGPVSDNTHNPGVLFSYNPAGGVFTSLHTFNGGKKNGANPVGAPLNIGGFLYGTTEAGGCASNPDDCTGLVYQYDIATGESSVLYRLSGDAGSDPQSALLADGNMLYGTSTHGGSGGSFTGAGAIFSTTFGKKKSTGGPLYTFTGGMDGAYPTSGLINVGGTFYGTTAQGGTYGAGAVYKYVP